jgi:hypothetical protein
MGGFLFAGSRNLGLSWNRAIPHLALSGLYCNPSLTRSGWDQYKPDAQAEGSLAG